jgi:Domain of unknown function (DUF4062)
MMTYSPTIRVFLSSPGDVSEERRLLRNVLDRFPHDPLLREPVYFETVAYDDPDAPVPMAANESPQQSVNHYKHLPEECDLTVVLLWSRIGTKLPVDQRKPDGSRYQSGTEWEYENAVQAKKTVWVYYRREPPSIDPKDPSLVEKLNQQQAVKRFIGRFTNPDGSLAGGYNVYDSPDSLPALFEKHLKSFVRKRLDGRPEGKPTTFRMGELSFPNKSPDLDKYYVNFENELKVGSELVGRAEIFTRLAEFADAHSLGYFRLTADAGLGKTTFAAAVALRRNAAAFFANASRGLTRADQCLNHLAATLIARFELAYDDLPPHSGESSALFDTILAEAVAKSDGPVWLVVDGLDEADVLVGRNALLLPPNLPDGVYCLITHAPGDYQLLTLPDTPVGGFEISNSPLQRADIDEYLRSQLARTGTRKHLDARTAEIGQDVIRERLREASQGNFRYLSYVLKDLTSGELALGNHTLPEGLLQYYSYTWARMEANAEARGGKDSRRVYRRVVGLLAVAREPVTLGWLVELSGHEPSEIRDEVLTTWRRYLSLERRGNNEFWRFPDRNFGEFLADKLMLSEHHSNVAAHYLPQSAWRKHNGYASRNLTAHLRLASNMDGVASLVDNDTWCESQLLVDRTGTAYQNDLMQASLAAFATDKADLEAGSSAKWLSREICWAFADASLRSYQLNVWPEMLAEFVSAGILTEGQVVAWASGIPKEFDRGRTLGALAPALSTSFRHKALDAVRTIQEKEDRVHSLLDFAGEVEGDERDSLLSEAMSIAISMPENGIEKVLALVHVADIAEMDDLSSGKRQRALAEAERIANLLIDDAERCHAFLYLLGTDPERSRHLGAALAAMRLLTDPDSLMEPIEKTLVRLSEADNAELARAMIDVADRISLLDIQIEWLRFALTALRAHERSGLGSKIRLLIESIVDPESRVTQLLELGDLASDDNERADLFSEAEQSIEVIKDDTARSVQFCRLAARLPGERGVEVWTEHVARLTKQLGAVAAADAVVKVVTGLPAQSKQAGLAAAEEIVRSLPDSMPKARMLMDIAQELDDQRSTALKREATRIPGGVLAAGVQTPDEIEFLELIAAFAARLTARSRELLADRAERIANSLVSTYARGCAFAALLPICGAQRHPQILDAVRVEAEKMDSPSERVELLLAVLEGVNTPDDFHVLEDAVQSARNILPGRRTTTVQVNSKTLVATAQRISVYSGRPSQALVMIALRAGDRRQELLEEAYDLAFGYYPAASQAMAFADLAPYLAKEATISTVAAVRALLQDPQRETLRKALQERAETPDLWNRAATDETDNVKTNNYNEKETDPASYQVLAYPQWFRVAREPQTSPVITSESQTRLGSTSSSSDQLAPEELVGIARAAVSVISSEHLEQANFEVNAAIRRWQEAMGQLLKRLAEVTSPSTALGEGLAVWPDGGPPPVCEVLLSLVAGEEKKRLLQGAVARSRTFPTAQDRAWASLGIYPHVRGSERDAALDRVREGLQCFGATAAAALAAATYSKAPEFSPVALREALHRVLQSSRERPYWELPVQQMVAVIEFLAGQEALFNIAESILAIRERWL